MIARQILRRPDALCVALLLLAMWAGLTLGHYQTQDPDSKLYIALAEQLSKLPPSQWCAPQWQNLWQRQGWFVEHPPLWFWLGAAWQRWLAMPAGPALYLWSMLAWIGELWLLYRLALQLGSCATAQWAVALWSCQPVFLQYLLRANHEHPLAFLVLLALNLLVGVPLRTWQLALLWGTCGCAAVLLKGIAGGIVLPLSLWLLHAQRRPWVWLLGAGTLVNVLGLIAFEYWYWQTTQTSFWLHYWQDQVRFSLGQPRDITTKLHNLVYYLTRCIWPVLPAWLCLLKWRKPQPFGIAHRLGFLALALEIIAYSCAGRRAERYLFPAYPLVCLSVASLMVEKGQTTWWPYGQQRLVLCIGSSLFTIMLVKIVWQTWVIS